MCSAATAPDELFGQTVAEWDEPLVDLEHLQFETAVEGSRLRRDVSQVTWEGSRLRRDVIQVVHTHACVCTTKKYHALPCYFVRSLFMFRNPLTSTSIIFPRVFEGSSAKDARVRQGTTQSTLPASHPPRDFASPQVARARRESIGVECTVLRPLAGGRCCPCGSDRGCGRGDHPQSRWRRGAVRVPEGRVAAP